jgi:glutathione S-transferase
MRLLGMLDSPYVRRLAVSMDLMGVSFTHEPLSVFRNFEDFALVNPVVKAPTLVTDCGAVLMDSSLILEYLESLVPAELHLRPKRSEDFVGAQRIVGLSLAACEKTVQIVYERKLRPSEKQHEPWLLRLQKQLLSAYELLERSISTQPWLFGSRPLQADLSMAVAWRFSQLVVPDVVGEAEHPKLRFFSHRAEQLPSFSRFPPQ